jgi:hypothetical protein
LQKSFDVALLFRRCCNPDKVAMVDDLGSIESHLHDVVGQGVNGPGGSYRFFVYAKFRSRDGDELERIVFFRLFILIIELEIL